MNNVCVNFTKMYWNFVLAFEKILEMFDNFMKFRYVSKTIWTNIDEFVQNFPKNF